MEQSKLLKPHEAAELLGVSKRRLEQWRHSAEGPIYVRLGHRTIRYHRADLDAFLDGQRVVAIQKTEGDFNDV